MVDNPYATPGIPSAVGMPGEGQPFGAPAAPGGGAVRDRFMPGPGAVAGAANPVVGILLQAATMLGINPFELATKVVQDPDGTAQVLDGAGVPGPETAQADPALGEALIGSQPKDYPDDPTMPMSRMVPGVGDAAAAAGSVAGGPASINLLPGQEGMDAAAATGPGRNVPGGQGGEALRAVLSGVVAPKPPTPPQLGTPGLPSTRGITGPTLDELVQSALRVAQPAGNATLQQAIGRR